MFGVSDDKKNPLGPIGDYVRANVERLRTERGLTYRELSGMLGELGRSVPPLGVSRIEKGARRVDADDLIAIAMAFGVSPAALLMPPATSGSPATAGMESDVALTVSRSIGWAAAWRWANGDQPLTKDGERIDPEAPEVRLHRWESRPYEAGVKSEVARWLRLRIRGPFRVEVEFDGERATTRLVQEEADDAGR